MTNDNGATGASADGIELLVSQHREVEQLFDMMDAARATGAQREMQHVRDAVVEDLSVHAVIEEELLYPLMRDVLPDGDRLVADGLQEHQKAKELLTRIDGKDPQADDFRAAWRDLVDVIQHHVEDEEQKDFPQLRERCDQEAMARLGNQLEKAAAVAPTHPHPHAPNEPPANVVVGGVAALVDKVRDAVRA